MTKVSLIDLLTLGLLVLLLFSTISIVPQPRTEGETTIYKQYAGWDI